MKATKIANIDKEKLMALIKLNGFKYTTDFVRERLPMYSDSLVGNIMSRGYASMATAINVASALGVDLESITPDPVQEPELEIAEETVPDEDQQDETNDVLKDGGYFDIMFKGIGQQLDEIARRIDDGFDALQSWHNMEKDPPSFIGENSFKSYAYSRFVLVRTEDEHFFVASLGRYHADGRMVWTLSEAQSTKIPVRKGDKWRSLNSL